MKRSGLGIFAILCCVAIGVACAAAPYRVLLVDGTKTLEGTLRVGGLAGAIRQSGMAEVSVVFSDVESPFGDLLAGKPAPESAFDLLILIPRGVGDGTADIVWVLVGNGLVVNPEAASSFSLLSSGIGLAFAGAVRVMGPLDDLWALIMASYYVAEGWLQ